jgi:hypothetical protein
MKKAYRRRPLPVEAVEPSMGRIVPLRALPARPSATSLQPTVLRLRSQMALMQGYAGLLDSLSPVMQARIFTAIMKTSEELVQLLEPYRTAAADAKPSFHDYRSTRMRTHQLLAEYRLPLTQPKQEVAGQRSLGDALTGTGGPHPSDPR